MIVTSVPTQQQQKFKIWMYVAGENWKVTLLFEHPSYYRRELGYTKLRELGYVCTFEVLGIHQSVYSHNYVPCIFQLNCYVNN